MLGGYGETEISMGASENSKFWKTVPLDFSA